MNRIAGWKSAPVLLGIVSFAAILFVWESVVRLGWANPFFISQPSAIAASLGRAARSGELWHNLAVSLREFAIGYAASVVVGILAGALAGRSSFAIAASASSTTSARCSTQVSLSCSLASALG